MNLFFVLTLILLSLLIIAAFLFFIFVLYAVVIGDIFGAPFVRSAKKRIKVMLELADIKPGETVMDLGSGDGTLLIKSAQKGASAIGVEINPFLVLYSKLRARNKNLDKKVKIFYGNLENYDLSEVDVLFIYLMPRTLEKLQEKFSKELKSGARVVSNSFTIPEWKHIMEKERVYLYQK